ncbi:MAG: hypothetical protein CVV22_08620 [Ignavibacteriae bacterium HGW-Ignavibacteriae-1]|jgi:hypothetical protein|nr:MAG: hypothetical protein CVV22_08620 [Ignavibacteriae bacterium HGW-Ignavibacteriae-1]
MENQFTDVMSERSDAELLIIVNEHRKDYQAAAVEAAEKELRNRNLNSEQLQKATTENEIKHILEIEKANIPLGDIWRVMAFLSPGILFFLYARIFKAQGYHRKARDLKNWTLYGFGMYLGFSILILVLFLIIDAL